MHSLSYLFYLDDQEILTAELVRLRATGTGQRVVVLDESSTRAGSWPTAGGGAGGPYGCTAYRLATLVIPYLNGDQRAADFGAALGGKQRAKVANLVGTLYQRDFARDVPPAPASGAPSRSSSGQPRGA